MHGKQQIIDSMYHLYNLLEVYDLLIVISDIVGIGSYAYKSAIVSHII